MRQCHDRHPSDASATRDPALHGVGEELEAAYADVLGEPFPADWVRLVSLLVERLDQWDRDEDGRDPD